MSLSILISGKNVRQRSKRIIKGIHRGGNADISNVLPNIDTMNEIIHAINESIQFDMYYLNINISGSVSCMSFDINNEAKTKNSIVYMLQSAINMLKGLKNDTSSCN